MNRRDIIARGAAGLALAAWPGRVAAQGTAPFAPVPPVPRLLARPDRIVRVTVCLRPFRAAGPRIEAEDLGRKTVVHHYGHGGSGWSLSWGSAMEAVPLALQTGAKEIAVIGAGAIGLTTAITAQRLGAKVTIYAKERFPQVRSARATGTWSPSSRIAMSDAVDAGFADRWVRMTRASFDRYQGFLGLPGDPVEWTDRYMLDDRPPQPRAVPPAAPPEVSAAPAEPRREFVALDRLVRDLTPAAVPLLPHEHPFPVGFARRGSSLTFNVADLAHQLEADFLAAGGRMVPAEFHEPADIARLVRERTVINCTGYGARALFGDESVVPVRGQIAWLIPQPGAAFGLYYRHLSVLARRDGIVVQPLGEDDWFGFGDADETPDWEAARAGVAEAAALFPEGVGGGDQP